MDLDELGAAKTYVWNKQHLLEVLTTGKNPILKDPLLIEAFNKIDRAQFVTEMQKKLAYSDTDLEIGFSQKINSPVLVAEMLATLDLKPGQKILELGTGSGYATAIMSYVVGDQGKVWSLERNQQLAQLARNNLSKYPFLHNYDIVFKDGAEGYISQSPFDAIYVAFAYDKAPDQLLAQLKIGGKLVTPLTNIEIRVYKRVSENTIQEQAITGKEFKKIQYGVE